MIQGRAVSPRLKFSFPDNEYDFGSRFVYRSGMSEVSTTLELTNEDQTKEIRFENKKEFYKYSNFSVTNF